MQTWIPLLGRMLLVLIYFNSGIGKILTPTQTMGYMSAAGMPLVGLFLVLAIIAELSGSVSVLLGYKTFWGALILVLFMIPTTLIFHTNFGDRVQMIMLMKNISMFGGLLLVLANGPGAWSLDHKLAKAKG